MSAFVLSERVDKSKIFLTNLSSVECRLDVFFYKKEFLDLVTLIKSNSNTKTLRSLKTFMKKGVFDMSPENYVNEGVPFLRVADITYEGMDFSSTVFINEKTHENEIKTEFLPGDIVIAKIGHTIGKVSILPYDFDRYNISQNVIGIKISEELKQKILPEYLKLYLTSIYGKNQVIRQSTHGAQPKITLDALRNIIIPLLDICVQEKLVVFYNESLNQKKQKETQAKQLLGSIDEYLLNELGVTLPVKDNSLENRIFTTSLSKVSGGRFDPKLYDNNTKALRESIAKSIYPVSKLKGFIIQSVAGDWGKDENEVLGDKFQKCLVIRATEFDNLYNLNLDNSRVKYRQIQKEKLERIDIQLNDLLIEKSGGSPDQPVGRIAILNEDIINNREICFSNFIHKIRVSSAISPDYLFCFLKTVHNIKLTDAMQSQTNGIRNLIMSNYFNQDIPVPTIEKQNEIANHIGQLREQAKRLQKEAVEELEKAKQEVEKIILGE